MRAVVAQPLPEAGCPKPSDGNIEKVVTDYVGEVMKQLENAMKRLANERRGAVREGGGLTMIPIASNAVPTVPSRNAVQTVVLEMARPGITNPRTNDRAIPVPDGVKCRHTAVVRNYPLAMNEDDMCSGCRAGTLVRRGRREEE